MAKTDKPVINPEQAPEEQIPTAQTEAAVKQKDESSTKSTAKAGKRSKKALEAAEVEQAKQARKQSIETSIDKPKQASKPARPKSERKGKNYREAAKQIDKSKTYSLKDALELAKKTSTVKFDASVELHVNLAVDPKQADQNIRGTLVLPHGTGKTVRVAVFDDSNVADADITGVDKIISDLEKGDLKFDVLISPPANMPKLGKYARLLGPRGLMPNPKSGTVTADLTKAVKEVKAGRVDYRVDSNGIVHTAVGKVSFSADQLLANAEAVVASIRSARPMGLKGNYMQTVHVTTSMGPSVKVDFSA